MHFGGIWPAQSVASVAMVHGGDAVDAAGSVVAHGAEEAAVELRLDAVERVGRERRAAGRAAAALEQHEPAQLGVAGIGRPDAGQVEVGRA